MTHYAIFWKFFTISVISYILDERVDAVANSRNKSRNKSINLLEWFKNKCDFEEIKPQGKNPFDVHTVRHYLGEKREGGFGKVTQVVLKEVPEGQTKSQKNRYAVKEISLQSIYDRDQRDSIYAEIICREIRMFQKLSPPPSKFIAPHRFSFVDSENVFLVSKYYRAGEMFYLRMSVGQFPEAYAKVYAYQILHAIWSLHERNIIHGDLKYDNIMVDDDGNLKLIDFGAADEDDGQTLSAHGAGSDTYMSPQLASVFLEDNKKHNRKLTDVWAFGVIWWCMFYNMFPFQSPNKPIDKLNVITAYKAKKMLNDGWRIPPRHRPMVFKERLVKGKPVKVREEEDETLSPQLRQLFIKVLNSDEEEKRLTAQQIMEDDYFKGVTEKDPAPFKPEFDSGGHLHHFIDTKNPDYKIEKLKTESSLKTFFRKMVT